MVVNSRISESHTVSNATGLVHIIGMISIFAGFVFNSVTLIFLACAGYFIAWISAKRKCSMKALRLQSIEETTAKMIAFIGEKPSFMNLDVLFLNGIYPSAIAYNKGKFHILCDGVVTTFTDKDVRDYTYNIPGHDRITMIGGNFGNHMQAAQYNNRQFINAARESGFSFELTSIDTPNVLFRTRDEALCKRWLEISRQVSEGRIEETQERTRHAA